MSVHSVGRSGEAEQLLPGSGGWGPPGLGMGLEGS